jgi:methyltransferase (TIGR00027 family)
MKDGRASRTAQHNALFRALDARRPPGERVADDRLAVRFLPTEFRLLAELARVGPVRRGLEAFIDRRWPGPREGVVARTRYIDEIVVAHAARVQQIVVLGAGLDTRAYRLAALANVRTFEVDHPSTQATKRRIVRRAVDTRNVAFVGVEFGRDDLAAALSRAGYRADARTLVLWEGVTNYLTADAVDDTFDAVAALVGGGAPVVFTYIDRGMLDGTSDFAGAGESAAHVERVGEPYTFGFAPDELSAYLSDRGFDLVSDTSVADAVRRYSDPKHASLGYAYYHVVEAARL